MTGLRGLSGNSGLALKRALSGRIGNVWSPIGPTNATATAVCHTRNNFCIVGTTGGPNIMKASGRNGTSGSVNSTAAANKDLRGIAWAPTIGSQGMLVACASSGTNRIITSLNGGSTWAEQTHPFNTNFASVCWAEDLEIFCVTANSSGGANINSADGINWSAGIGAGASMGKICRAPELGIFCTSRGFISPDGVNWTRPSPIGCEDIVWSARLGLLCAVSGSTGANQLFTSPDGLSWQTSSINGGTLTSWSGIAWAPEPGLLCAVASSGGARIAISPNAVDWTTVPAGLINYRAVAWSPFLEEFLAVGDFGSGQRFLSSF